MGLIQSALHVAGHLFGGIFNVASNSAEHAHAKAEAAPAPTTATADRCAQCGAKLV